MYYLKTFGALALCIPFWANGQTTINSIGARSYSLAEASVTLKDEWSYFNNIAGLTAISKAAISSSFISRFNAANLNSTSFLFSYPFKYISCAAGFIKYGNNLYNEQAAGFGIAGKIHHLSLGFKANYFQLSAAESSMRRCIILESGGQVNLSKQLTFGAHVWNISGASVMVEESRQPLPVVMKAGLSYAPHKNLLLLAEAYKEVVNNASVRLGVEYSVLPILKLRAGLASFPLKNFSGAGLLLKRFCLDYAFSSHRKLGFSHHLSFSYLFKSR